MSGSVTGASSNAKMFLTVELLKKAGQIQEQAADKLINQAMKQMKASIGSSLEGGVGSNVDVQA